MKIEILLLSEMRPTLRREEGKSSKESAWAVCVQRWWKGSAVTCLAELLLWFAMLVHLRKPQDGKIGCDAITFALKLTVGTGIIGGVDDR